MVRTVSSALWALQLFSICWAAPPIAPRELHTPAVPCPSTGDDPDAPVFVPSLESCSQFYLCSHGIPYLLSCPTGLYFNPQTQQCDYPYNVNCTAVTTTAQPEPTSSAEPVSTSPSRSSTEAPRSSPATSTRPPVHTSSAGPDGSSSAAAPAAGVPLLDDAAGCPAESRYPVLLPNAADCSTYFVCEHGRPRLMPCPQGLYFNNDTWTCDFPWNVDCSTLPSSSTASPSNATTPAPPNTTTPPYNGTAEQLGSHYLEVFDLLSEDKQEADDWASCPAEDGAFPVFLPNPRNCSTFFECSHGTAVLHVCPDHLLFNNHTWTCDFSFNVDCVTV